GWDPAPMRRAANGVWKLSVPVPGPGGHAYKYVVDGRWIADPSNGHRESDGFGGLNSLLWVSG
ncbi:MAG: glycogen-binding domain-containing protein, partial [Candidatus Eremiobacterota bacterium]